MEPQHYAYSLGTACLSLDLNHLSFHMTYLQTGMKFTYVHVYEYKIIQANIVQKISG